MSEENEEERGPLCGAVDRIVKLCAEAEEKSQQVVKGLTGQEPSRLDAKLMQLKEKSVLDRVLLAEHALIAVNSKLQTCLRELGTG